MAIPSPTSRVKDQECVVSGALYVVLRVCQVLGVAPVRFSRAKDGWAMRASNFLGIISYVLTTVLALSYLGGMVLIQRKMPVHISVQRLPVTEVVLGICGNLSIMIVPILMSYSSLRRLKTITIGMSRIQKITQISRSLFRISRKNFSMILAFIIFIWTIAALNKWFLSFGNLLPEALLQHCAIDILRQMTLFTILQYMLVTSEVRSVLQLVNNRLSELPLEEITEKGDVDSIDRDIGTLFEMYGTICRVVEEMNEAFGFTIMTILWLSCWALVLYPYCLTQSFRARDRTLFEMYGTICRVVEEMNEAFGFTIMTILWLSCWALVLYPYCLTQSFIPELFTWSTIFYFVSEFFIAVTWLLMVVEPSHGLNFELSRTVSLVTRLSLRHRKQPASAQLELFHHHLLLCKVSYSPMHVCVIDRPLIVTLTGFIITYLVICIQLKELGDKQ